VDAPPALVTPGRGPKAGPVPLRREVPVARGPRRGRSGARRRFRSGSVPGILKPQKSMRARLTEQLLIGKPALVRRLSPIAPHRITASIGTYTAGL